MSADLTPTKAGTWRWRFLTDRGYDCAVYVCEGAGGRLYWRNGDMCVVVRPDDLWRGPVTPPEEVSALRATLAATVEENERMRAALRLIMKDGDDGASSAAYEALYGKVGSRGVSDAG